MGNKFKVGDKVIIVKAPPNGVWPGGADTKKSGWLKERTILTVAGRIGRYFGIENRLPVVDFVADPDSKYTLDVDSIRHANQKRTIIMCSK